MSIAYILHGIQDKLLHIISNFLTIFFWVDILSIEIFSNPSKWFRNIMITLII